MSLGSSRHRRERTLPTFATLLVLGVLLMTFDIRGGADGPLTVVRDLSNQALIPLQRAAYAVVNPLVDLGQGLGDIANQQTENDDLRARLAGVQAELASVQDSLERLEVLEQLHDLELAELKVVNTPANVIGRSDSFDFTFRIDKGQAHGVLTGHPVIDQHGYAVGRVVTSVGSSATVIPLTSDVEGVTVLAGGTIGTVSALRGTNSLQLAVFDHRDPLLAGSQVVTSFQSVSFPPGIPVGEVTESAFPVSGALTAPVRPFSGISRLRVVSVLAWPPDLAALTEANPSLRSDRSLTSTPSTTSSTTVSEQE